MRQDWGTAHAARSVEGNPLKINGVSFDHGVGTHANSEFNIRLNGGAERFTATVGIDDENNKGTIRFEVWGDKKRLFDSGIVKGGMPGVKVDVPLKGVKVLQLVVSDGGDGIDSDHGDWADAQIWLAKGSKFMPTAILQPGTEDLNAPPIKIAMGTPPKAWIHGARVVGTTPGRPFLYRIPATGTRPIAFSVVSGSLPAGVTLDTQKGILSGKATLAGTAHFTIEARNRSGRDRREYTVVAGLHKLAMTPPMGWNSWNVWAIDVNQEHVKAAADRFVSEGLADYGYGYVNIDDAWEDSRDAEGNILPNKKFPDMQKLSAYIHSLGLKLGIYSSPGPKTCGGYEASYQHELQDARSYANWGVDYLKYDWCSYGDIAPRPTIAELQKPYLVMRDALDQVDRDIVFSLCQYGMGDVYNWGKSVTGGNLWRTTGDINDSWNSMATIGFAHSEKAIGAGPGGWNDPDMLVVGKLGWGGKPRPTRLTPNEQITHITLWSMLAAPLLIGCDLTQIDPFTKAILTNHDVIEVDQDPKGVAATRKWKDGDLEIWTRPLWDGTTAVGVFNRSRVKARIQADFSKIGITGRQAVRDLWQMKDIGTKAGVDAQVPAHGSMLFKVGKPKA